MFIDTELYDSIQSQFPSVYDVNELYPIQHRLFSPVFSYFASKNRVNTLRIFKAVASKTIISVEVFRFTKKKALVFENTNILVAGNARDEEDYNYFKKLLDNTKKLCYNASITRI